MIASLDELYHSELFFLPISSSCESLMIAGIDTEAMFARAAPLGFSAFQGGLWPPVPVSQLIKLVQR